MIIITITIIIIIIIIESNSKSNSSSNTFPIATIQEFEFIAFWSLTPDETLKFKGWQQRSPPNLESKLLVGQTLSRWIGRKAGSYVLTFRSDRRQTWCEGITIQQETNTGSFWPVSRTRTNSSSLWNTSNVISRIAFCWRWSRPRSTSTGAMSGARHLRTAVGIRTTGRNMCPCTSRHGRSTYRRPSATSWTSMPGAKLAPRHFSARRWRRCRTNKYVEVEEPDPYLARTGPCKDVVGSWTWPVGGKPERQPSSCPSSPSAWPGLRSLLALHSFPGLGWLATAFRSGARWTCAPKGSSWTWARTEGALIPGHADSQKMERARQPSGAAARAPVQPWATVRLISTTTTANSSFWIGQRVKCTYRFVNNMTLLWHVSRFVRHVIGKCNTMFSFC